ncbi:Chromate resistance protein ChrB [Actinoplanes sp. NPDC023801]|uniref:Chromate resistance protein ChrB n=1 Tax=Actinoplanes sp. NPDC023801 TaxID=3154595 RepID=UPI0033EB5E88
MERVRNAGQWVLLSYRMPREPSQPRIAVWRKLERLGVARLGDGLIALPADDRTREQLDWVAEEVADNGGSAMIWIAAPGDREQEQAVIEGMRTARAAEYRQVIEQATTSAADEAERTRLVRKLRGELRRITDRDYFPPAERETARIAVQELAEHDITVKERA